MNVKFVLGELKERGVALWLDGDQIRINGTGEPLSSKMLAELKDHKPEIMQILKEEQPKPYLNGQGDLVIPFGSDTKFQWWRPGSLSSWEIRDELKKRMVN